MTEHTLSGAGGDPSQGAHAGSDPAEFLSFRDPGEPSPGAPQGSPEPPPAESDQPGTAVGEPDRPRRRRRGGARRRRRSTRPAQEGSEEEGASAAEPAPLDAPLDDEEPGQAGLAGEPQAEAPPGEAAAAPATRKKRRRRRRKTSATGTSAEDDKPTVDELLRSSAIEAEDDEDDEEPEAAAGEDAGGRAATAGQEGSRKRRRRRRRRRKEPAEAEDASDEGEDEADAGPARSAREEAGRGRRRRRSSGDDGPVAVEGIPGEDDELESPEEGRRSDEDEDEEPPARGSRRGEGVDPKGRNQRERAAARARSGRANRILVNAADREETRVAVVEGERICDFQMNSRRHKSLVNDIYRGRVVNLEPAIGAAFIDFGQGRNGFLHTSDVLSAYGDEDWKLEKLLTTQIDPEEWDEKSSQPDVAAELDGNGEEVEEDEDVDEEGAAAARESGGRGRGRARGRGRKERGRGGRPRARPRLPIGDLLEKGDVVVVQVTKDAIGDKGPTLTTYISIPGRYLVLMPSMSRTGVSRKIEDEKERRRLKRILESLDVPPGMGVIVRTAGTGCTKAEIKRDLDYLLLLWESFGQRLTLGRGPAPLYEESDVVIRTIRDLFSDDTEAIVVDDEKVYKRVREFVERLMPENLDKVQLHSGPRPLYHTFNVEQDFERIFARRIDLPSGGSIVIDQTEALVAIDVNSGKTRSDGADFEDVALRTNLDAVPEIARQIRLRDLGGILVVDFIDMLKSSHRRQVERALRDALAGDRARSKVGRISQFGLLEMTRQRLGPGLSKMLFSNCPRCRGSGRLRTVESRSEAILRRLGSALTLKGFTRVELRATPEVVEHLEAHYGQALKDLEGRHQRELTLVGVPDQVEDSVLRYLRADGREVRPGGRRKR